MHGVLLWTNQDGNPPWVKSIEGGGRTRYHALSAKVSPLYTWQDKRCDRAFLQTLPTPESHLSVHAGFGTATLFWLLKHKKAYLSTFNCSGTIQDFVVAMLCGLQKPVISTQNAASWGYFDCQSNQWNVKVLDDADFPVGVLPKVCENEEVAGDLSDSWFGVPIGTSMGVALGDLQCSVLSTLEQPDDAILNISTSAQLCFVAKNFKPRNKPAISPVEHFPYFKNEYLAVAASLNGGNVLAHFVSMLQQWTQGLGAPVEEHQIWNKLLDLPHQKPASLKINPALLGERHQPEATASVTKISPENLSLGGVFRSICEGLVENIYKMMPRDVLVSGGVTRVIGSGGCLLKNRVLQEEFKRWYGLELVTSAVGGDAAKGAALVASLCEAGAGPFMFEGVL